MNELYRKLQDAITFLRSESQEIHTVLVEDARLNSLHASVQNDKLTDRFEAFLQQQRGIA